MNVRVVVADQIAAPRMLGLEAIRNAIPQAAFLH